MTHQRTKRPSESFVANIPFQIEAEWNLSYAYLAGFPLNLLYTGLRPSDAGAQPHVAVAYYRPVRSPHLL